MSPVYTLSSAKTQKQVSENAAAAPRCGSRSHPWIVDAQTGQQISISLLDFSQIHQTTDDVVSDQAAAVRLDADRSCDNQYGYIIDKTASTLKKNITICGGKQRQQFLYQSKGSAIEVVVTVNSDEKFLLGFQGFLRYAMHFSSLLTK